MTETVDARKYLLDINKVQRFPITFVVKSDQTVDALKTSIRTQATARYSVTKVVERYMSCVEEVINIPKLLELFDAVVKAGKLQEVLEEIVRQSRLEFNYEEDVSKGDRCSPRLFGAGRFGPPAEFDRVERLDGKYGYP